MGQDYSRPCTVCGDEICFRKINGRNTPCDVGGGRHDCPGVPHTSLAVALEAAAPVMLNVALPTVETFEQADPDLPWDEKQYEKYLRTMTPRRWFEPLELSAILAAFIWAAYWVVKQLLFRG